MLDAPLAIMARPGITASPARSRRARQRVEEADAVMMRFAERTGLTSARQETRYLWTDAFAVCNFLAIARASGDERRYTDLAVQLVDRVHHTLGTHRPDAPETGWLSGLDAAAAEAHPTCGGLRIGKNLPERRPDEPFDPDLEWDRDGQYFHYLTRWMHALDQVARATRQPIYNQWARELAAAAHAAFTYRTPGRGAPRMVWKKSVDLSRTLIPSMGQHDPLDGFITCVQLRATASALPGAAASPDLARETEEFAAMVAAGDWATADPLGIGGLLMDACRVEQLMERGALSDDQLLVTLLAAAFAGLRHYGRRGDIRRPAATRLGFRELGLAIGLGAVELMERTLRRDPARIAHGSEVLGAIERFEPYVSLGWAIESFWLDPSHRAEDTWTEHLDINEVMLATSLVPEGVLRLSE